MLPRAACPPSPKMKSNASAPSRATSIRFAIPCFLKTRSANSKSVGLSSTRRISVSPESGMLPSRQCEMEGGANIQFRFRPEPAAVPLDNALHQRQAHAGAFIIVRQVQALEDAK